MKFEEFLGEAVHTKSGGKLQESMEHIDNDAKTQFKHHQAEAVKHAHEADKAKAAGDHKTETHHKEKMDHHLHQAHEHVMSHALDTFSSHNYDLGHDVVKLHRSARDAAAKQAKKHDSGSHAHHAHSEIQDSHRHGAWLRNEHEK